MACGVSAPDAEPADLAIVGAQLVDGRVRAAILGFSYPGGSNSGFTNTPTTEEEARAMVREQAALGVHFTKMWINEVAEAARRTTPPSPPRAARHCKKAG